MKSRYDFTTEQDYREYLRFYFSGMAMQGLLANSKTGELLAHKQEDDSKLVLSVASVKMADSLIEALNKTEK